MEDRSVHQARRLCELFKGRFNEDVGRKLIDDFGGEAQAIDFLMREDQEQVRKYLHQTPAYVDSLRNDCAKVASILENGFATSVRQFACGDCNRSWWKRVPLRKEVSRCKRCHVKYDPIPRDKEWGLGKFICQCGKEFTGSAVMGMTESECYQCGVSVLVDHMVPPRRDRPRKTNAPHSCNAANCYNCPSDIPRWPSNRRGQYGKGIQDDGDQGPGAYPDDGDHRPGAYSDHGDHRPGAYSDHSDQGPGAYPDPPPEQVCIHPKSSHPPRKRIRTASQRHVSTGSTVATFLSQGSIDTQTVSVAYTLATISELD